MSGIFGILSLDGQPVSRASLDQLRQAMAQWGPHGSAIWQAGKIGLGHLLQHNAPEAAADDQPIHHLPSGVTLTAQARLDNPAELRSALAGTIDSHAGEIVSAPSIQQTGAVVHAAQHKISDARLVLLAYLHWGAACVHHLLGDWSFALWDSRHQKLFLARNHFGISSLFYVRAGGVLAFASSIKGLLALPQVPQRLNLLRVAQVLTAFPGDGVQTAYEGILQLPNAHTMTVTDSGTEIKRYWDPGNTPLLHLPTDDAYVDTFLEIYTKAIQSRLTLPASTSQPARLGVTLSSGLDSGSVCALTARQLRASNQRLTAFTAIPIYPTEGLTSKNWYGNEAPLVEINRNFIPNLDVHYIRAENFGPLAGLTRDLELHDSPMHAAGNMFWIYELLATAKQQGIDVLLTGQTGNATISWTGGGAENFWPLILSGRWRTFWQKSRQVHSLTKVIRSHILRPLATPIQRQMERLQHARRPAWESYSAIHLNFARAIELQQQMDASGHDPLFTQPADPRQAQQKLFRLSLNAGGSSWAVTAAAYGLEVRDPTMDKRLVEFCLAIPQEQYRLHGRDRSLIRRSMRGLLPDQVRLNTRRGRQAADIGHRILAELPQVQALMAQLKASSLAGTVLDLPRMQAVLDALQAEVNQNTTQQTVTILTRGLMAGQFLLRFD